LIVYNCL